MSTPRSVSASVEVSRMLMQAGRRRVAATSQAAKPCMAIIFIPGMIGWPAATMVTMHTARRIGKPFAAIAGMLAVMFRLAA